MAHLTIDSPLSEFSQILPNLYLTGESGITQLNIDKHRINFIINVTVEVPDTRFAGVGTFRLELADITEEDIGVHFDSICDRIERLLKRGKNVVVHCKAGCSRSATFVIAYLMKYKGLVLRDAYNFVKERRPLTRPNPGFFQHLVYFEQHLFGENTVKMETLQGLDGYTLNIPDVYIED